MVILDSVRPARRVPGAGVPLTLLQSGATAVVDAVLGGGEARRLLGELGFVPGSEVSVVAARDGDLIVLVKGARIALDRGMARRVITK